MTERCPLTHVDYEMTFVRIYRLPEKLTEGYCFGSGRPIIFTNVDWMETPVALGPEFLSAYVRGKVYYDPSCRYLVLGDRPEFVFLMERQS